MTTDVLHARGGSQPVRTHSSDRPAFWGGVFAMTLCVFTLIASEFLPVSLLTPMAAELGVSEGIAGNGMAISGALAVLTSLSISNVAGAMNRKTLLLLMTALMCVSGLVVGFAPDFFTYMIGRALIGVVVGGFWSMSAAVAMRLVPTPAVPKALAVFNGGNALASIAAAPLGSYLGGIIGWRGAFFCLVPVGLVALLWQWVSLPSMEAEEKVSGSRNVLKLFNNRSITLGMLAVGAFFMGQFMLFTYVRPFLEAVTRVDVGTLSMILLVIGIAGFVGTTFIGSFLKSNMYRTLIAIPLSMAAIALALVSLGRSVAIVFVLLAVWGLVATAAPVGWWSWVAKTLPTSAEAGGGLMVATVQLCIAVGSSIGGLLFDGSGYRITFIASAGLLLFAALMAFLTSRSEQVQPG